MSAIALLDRRGGCATKKYCEATTVGTDGVVVQSRTIYLNNHPVRSLSMLRDFFDVAATPPVQEGQCPTFHFIHTFRPSLKFFQYPLVGLKVFQSSNHTLPDRQFGLPAQRAHFRGIE